MDAVLFGGVGGLGGWKRMNLERGCASIDPNNIHIYNSYNTYIHGPQAAARGNIQRGIMAGKLKGQMPAHTPRGCLYE